MTGTPEMMKQVNMNLIYQALIEMYSATRSELADKTKISLTTIRALLNELLIGAQILETALDASSGGRRAQRYTLNPKKNLVLSLYYQNKTISYQISNLNNDIVYTGDEQFEEIVSSADIIPFIEACMQKWDICSVGLGVSGVVEHQTYYEGCEMDNLTANRIGEAIQEKLNIPVILENNLNAIAYGYAIHYSHEHLKCPTSAINIAYIHVSDSSISAGFVVDGRILHGSRQFAGELGFMPLEKNRTLVQLLQDEDDVYKHIDILCRTIAIIHCITNPALIVIGGDRFEASKFLPEQFVTHLKQHYLGDKLCPAIHISYDMAKDYLMGIQTLTLDHMIPLLTYSAPAN